MICLLCGENETPDCTHDRICGRCYENAGDYLEQNIHLIKAIPYLLDAAEMALEEVEQWNDAMGRSTDPRTRITIETLRDAIARCETPPSRS